MDVRTLKFISIPVIFAVNFISGFVPYFLISRNIRLDNSKSDSKTVPLSSPTQQHVTLLSPKMKRILTLANFFSAGVFLSTCIIGLYPGVNTKFNKIVKNYTSNAHPYPFAGLTLAGGFFLVWLLEILVHCCIHAHGHAHSHNYSDGSQKPNNVTTSNNNTNKESIMLSSEHCSAPSIQDRLISNHEQDQDQDQEEVCANEQRARHQSQDHEPHSHVPITGNLLGSVMLTFALGSHSIIEGIGFAVIDDFNGVLSMLITVVIHEAVCAVSLGVQIASRHTALKPSLVLVAIFSVLIPVGVCLGLALDSTLHKNLAGDVTIAVLQGLAAGTFVYVVFMEILPNEMSHRRDAFLRLATMVLGFAVIAAMKYGHSHSDSLSPTIHNASISAAVTANNPSIITQHTH